MIKIHTQLHLALLLNDRLKIDNRDCFLLGSVYSNICDLTFKEAITNDFNFGCFFHKWVKDHFSCIDLEDITMYDCLICDMEVVGPIVLEIKEKEFTGNKQEAKECVMQLERVPMPLYFVFEEKREKYKAKLNELIDMFFCEFDL